jgi:Fe(3+) dicitrate transport protein
MENVFNLNEKWSITPGVRYEFISTAANGYYRIINKDLAGNIIHDERVEESKLDNRSFVFIGIGSSFRPSEGLEFYSNFSQNYRAINFNDIRVNVGSLRVDENLRDEKGFNFDLGCRGKLGKLLDFDLSIYHLSYNDRIGTILQKEPNPIFNNLVDRVIRYRTNIADAKIFGLESLLEFQISEWWNLNNDFEVSLFTNLSITNATYQSSEIPGQKGKYVEVVPPFIFKTGLSARWKSASFNLQYGHIAKQFSDASNAIITPTAIEGIIPAYQVVDLSTRFTFDRYEIEAGINNLLDASYFTRRATGYPGPGIIPSQGRSFYMTFGIKI